jgi:hypothetical protein
MGSGQVLAGEKKMKTKLFYSIMMEPEVAKAFLSDLHTVFRSPAGLRLACIGVLPELADKMTTRQSMELAKSVAREQGTSIVEVLSNLQSLQLLTKTLADEDVPGDSIDDMLLDLEESGKAQGLHITEDDKSVFRDLVTQIQDRIVPSYRELQRRKAAASGVLPSLKSFGTTVELRAVAGKPFRIGMSADKYEPEILGLVPVISVSLGVDSGPIQHFSFQASPKEITALIEELRSAFVCLQQSIEKCATGILSETPPPETQEESEG